MAEIVRLYDTGRNRYRADVRLHSGGGLRRRVRIPGPSYDRQGRMHGIQHGFMEGQAVLVGYLGNLTDLVVIASLSFPGGDRSKQNLSAAEDYDPTTQVIGHESGYRVEHGEDLVSYRDKDGEEVILFDFEKKEIRLKQGWSLAIEGASPADSTILTSAAITTPGTVAAPGGVSMVTGQPPTPGLLVATAVSTGSLSADSVDATSASVNGKPVDGHTHGPTGSLPF